MSNIDQFQLLKSVNIWCFSLFYIHKLNIARLFFTALQSDLSNSGLATNINDGLIPFGVLEPGSLCMLTRRHSIVNVINYTCASPAVTSQNVCFEKTYLKSSAWVLGKSDVHFIFITIFCHFVDLTIISVMEYWFINNENH